MGEQEQGSVFDRIVARMATRRDRDIIPLHIGDTYLPVAGPAGLEAFDPRGMAGYGAYAPTRGLADLRRWIATKARTRNGLDQVDQEWVQVTAGATNALFAALVELVGSAGEVLLTAPWWPVITAVCEAARVPWRPAPLYLELAADPGLDPASLLDRAITPRTRALYLSSPNNPSGVVLSREQLAGIADWARRRDLLVISDEAYEDFIFTDREHVSIASLPGMAERTVTAFTFSKSCALSGYRLGYALAPPAICRRLDRMVTGTIYNAPTPAQGLVLRALERRDEWFPAMKEKYRRAWELIRRELQAPFLGGEGGFFLFADVSRVVAGGDIWELVDRLLDAGVSVTPGVVSGPDYGAHIRICFVAVEPERLRQGVERLNGVIGG